MKSLLRFLKWVVVGVVCGFVCIEILFWYLNLDKTRVFFDVAGQLGRVETVSAQETDTSSIRQLKIYNDRGDYLVDCWYRRPRHLTANYRALVMYSGVTTKEAVLDLVPEWPDIVICAIQYPYERPRTFVEYLRWPCTVRGAAYQVVGGGILATTFLIEREKLEAGRMTIVGASLGSIFGGIHGSLDTRIPKTLIVHGGGNFRAITLAYPRLKEKGRPVLFYAWLGDRVFGTFDPLRYVDRISPRELIILATRNDRYFPPESAQSLYDRAKEPKKIFWRETAHLQSKQSDVLDSILNSLRGYLFSDTMPG